MNQYKRNRTFLNYLSLGSALLSVMLSIFDLAPKVFIFFLFKFAFSISLYFGFYILFEDENAEKLKYSFWTHLFVYLLSATLMYFLDFSEVER